MRLSGIMLGSEDAKALGTFYTKIFGNPGWQEGGWYGFDIGGGSLMVGPHSEVKGKSLSPGRVMFAFVSADVPRDAAHLVELGVEVIAPAYQPDKESKPEMWIATFADIDGNYFQLMTPWKDEA